MENIERNQIICRLCGKSIQPLGIESKIILSHSQEGEQYPACGSELYPKDFEKDQHLFCRIRCAKYYTIGLGSRWLAPDKFVITDNNRNAHSIIESMKGMSYEQLKSRGIYLYGQPGTGKTHLLASLCSHLVDRGERLTNIKWINTSSMLTAMRSSFGKKYEYGEGTDQEKILVSLNRRYLFVDDLGTENTSDWAREILYGIINYRYEERLPIFISSNLSPKDLAERLGDKFASRVVEMCEPVRIVGEDWRLKKTDMQSENNEINKTKTPVFSYQMAYWDKYEEYQKIIKAL